jgi:peptidoglycan glycosyltransferase
VDLERGLIVSCNAYFAQLALAIGPRAVLDSAALFQIGVARSPTPDALRPMLAHVGYGQGEAVVSPLKLARVSASIASGGTIAPLRWEPPVDGAKEPKSETWPRFLSKADADRLARTMRAVVTSGTARALRSHAVAIAGKTGTAEKGVDPGDGIVRNFDQSWWCGYGPYEDPKLVVCALIENGGHGGTAAAPAALKVFEEFFHEKAPVQGAIHSD